MGKNIIKDQRGFAENFLKENQINCIVVLCKSNHWYQVPTIVDLCDKINGNESYQKHKNTFLYGQSMGGSACLLLRDFFPFSDIVAISPLYDFDEKTLKFENRWKEDFYDFEIYLKMGEMNFRGQRKCLIIYDDKGPDNYHINRM